MKPTTLRKLLAIASISLLAISSASAITYTWTQTATGDQDWTTAGNWDASTQFVSGSGNELMFFADTSTTLPANINQTVVSVPAALSMNTLTLNGKGPNNTNGFIITIGDNSAIWTIGDGTTSTVNLNSTLGGGTSNRDVRYTIPANLTLSGDSSGITSFTGNSTSITGAVFSGNITETSAGKGLTKSGSHLLIFSGNNNYTGTTSVTGGTLRLNSATALSGGTGATGGTSALTLNGGVVELGAGDFSRGLGSGSSQFQITGGNSGFSAIGGPRVVSVNGNPSQQLVWGSTEFAPTVLELNTATANNSIELTNDIDLGSSTRTIRVAADKALLSGDISGATGIIRWGAGTLILTGNNTYTGDTTLGSGGTLSVSSAANLGASSGNLNFNNGVLQITGTALTNIASLGRSSVSFTSNQAVGFDIDSPGNTFTVDQVLNQGTGTFTKRGAGTLVLNQDNTFTGATTATGGGTLVLDYSTNNDSKLGNSTALNLNGGNLVLRGGSHPEAVGSIVLAANTGNSISRDGSSTATLANAGVLTTNTLSNLNIAEAGIVSTTTANVNGIQTLGRVTVGSHFATKDGGNLLQAYGSYTEYTAGGTAGSLTTVNQLNGGGTMTGDLTSYSLRIANTGNSDVLNLNSGVDLRVSNGGTILYAGGSDNNYTINGAGSSYIGSNSGNQALNVNVFTGTLTVNAILTSGGSSPLAKSGAGTLVAGGTSTYSGATYVQQGTLMVNGSISSSTGNVTVSGNAHLGGTGSIGGNVTVQSGGGLKFDLTTPAGSHNPLDLAATKTLNFSGNSVLTITSSGGSPAPGTYTLLTAPGGIFGAAPATVNLPSGWAATTSIVGNDLVLNVTSTGSGGSAYDTWATGNEPFDGDANGDGVKDGLAFLLGAANPSENAIGRLPTVTRSGGGLILTFNCLPIAARGSATLKVAHSTNLVSWTATTDVVPDANDPTPDNNVTFVVGTGPAGPPALNSVTATIDSAAAAAGKLFGRLEATQP